MMRSLFAGVSGLRVHQTKMDVIGNNISNVNTPGFKKSRVTFQEMLNQTLRGASAPQDNRGGTNPVQIGLGVNLGSIDVIHSPGSPQSTGKALDMSIEGEGYFVVGDATDTYFTRAGNFDFDTGNNLVTPNGWKVKGWVATIDPTNGFNLDTTGEAQPINLNKLAESQVMQATKNVEIGKNIDSRINIQSANTTFTSTITAAQISNLPGTEISIQLPEGVVFDENFSIGAITYTDLIANPNDWTLNPSTGELILKGNSAPPVDEVQTIDLTGSAAGDDFTLTLTTSNGTLDTASITVDADPAVTATNIENALNALGNLGGGTVTVVDNGSGGFDVTFTGGDIGAKNLDNLVINPGTLSGTPSVTEKTPGETNIMSNLVPDAVIGYRKADHQTPITIYDSQGNSHDANILYYKSGGNKWLANVVVDNQLLQLKSSPSTPANTEFVHEIEFNANGQIISGNTLNINYVFPNGNPVDPLSATIDFNSLTQVASDTTALALSQDGFEPGSLQSISVDPTGTIVGTFSNGQNLDLAQVAIATFRNPSGLMKTGNTLFKESKNSGNAQVGIPGTAGRGLVKPETLEMSNVDLSQEFVDMITTQRGFQANSRIITTSDEMLQELVNLRR